MSSAVAVAEEHDALRAENRRLVLEKDELNAKNGELGAKLRELNKKLELYEEQAAWLKNKLYGRGSEQLTDAERMQIRLFDELEHTADNDPEDPAPAEPPPDEASAEVLERTRGRPRRRPLPQALPRVEQVIDLPEQDKQCECGHPLVRIGEDTSEKLDVIPPQVQVIRTVRPKYACHHCEGSGDEEHPAVRVAPPPAALIPKGLASEGLLAFIATAKFCDALPLYRQERQFARLGAELSRRTMSDWMIAAAGACRPLMEALLDKLRCGPILQIDETTVQVLKEDGRANTDTSYVWVARGGPPDEPVVVYRYEPSRAGAALQALGFIAKLYRAEAQLAKHREEDPAGFVAARRAQVQPVLDAFHGWLLAKGDQVLPSSALGKAVAFALGEWPKLIRYLEHPQLTPDNNACEQAIRPFVVGRKNWLFSGSPRGAAASAILYSLIETAKANRREPYWYLRELFEKLPHARTRADYLTLLPTPRPPPPAS